jgi:hypothetical protein
VMDGQGLGGVGFLTPQIHGFDEAAPAFEYKPGTVRASC